MVQIVLTQTHGLSPWKGGGFGMFAVSTHRMMTIEAETTDGRFVKIAHRPGGFEQLGWMNDADTHRQLAEALIGLDYVDTLDGSDAFLSKMALDDPGAAAKVAEMLAKNQKDRDDADRSIWLRPPDEAGPPEGATVHRLAKLTLKRWRVVFEPETDRLRLVADGEPIVAEAAGERSLLADAN